MRSFEFVGISECGLGQKTFVNAKLSEYQTKYSAGADFFCAEDVVIPSVWKMVAHGLRCGIGKRKSRVSFKQRMKEIKPTLVHTGIKSQMEHDEVLILANRSSNPLKFGLVLSNGVGVVDADYYGNANNDGEIMFGFYNFSLRDIHVRTGERIGQGIFQKFLRPDCNCNVKDNERQGGFGHTG